MRIVLVLDTAFMNGGLAKVAFDSARGLKAMGHEPILFAAAGPVDERLKAAGVEVHCLDQQELKSDGALFQAAWRGIHNAEAAAGLEKLLASLPPGDTVIHVHGWAKALSSSIAEPIRKSGLPCLWTMHEYFVLCPNGGFYNYKRHEHCHLKPLSLPCLTTHCDSRTLAHKMWRSVRTGVLKHVHHLYDVMKDIACFHPYQRAIIAPHVGPDVRLHEVANPVEVEKWGPKENPASGDFVFLARISMEKGPFIFAEAARIAGITPVFVGDGPLAGELKKRYPEARILPWQDTEGVRRTLRAARALVFPSIWYEGQPLTVLESLALGTPVITSDDCAGRESVIDGETGLWFKDRSPQDLARALIEMKDDARVSTMSEAAHRLYWANPFTVQRHCHRLLEVYGEMLSRKAG